MVNKNLLSFIVAYKVHCFMLLSEHERTHRSSSAASDRADKTGKRMARTIRSSMEVQKAYTDTIQSLENTCNDRLL